MLRAIVGKQLNEMMEYRNSSKSTQFLLENCFPREIGFRLKKRIRDHPESVGETLRLLQQLGEETGSLLEVFVQCQRLRLAQMVGAAR